MKNIFTSFFLLFFALSSNGQNCTYSITPNYQSQGGEELILKPRPDLGPTSYELFIHHNKITDLLPGPLWLSAGPRQTWTLTDTCAGKYQSVQRIAFGGPLRTIYTTHPFTGDSSNFFGTYQQNKASLLHETCADLPSGGAQDSFVYKRRLWFSQIITLPYTCGKWQININGVQGIFGGNYLDSCTNVEYSCNLPYQPPSWGNLGFANVSTTHGACIQFSNLQQNAMPGYASDLSFLARAHNWTTIDINPIDAEGDSLVFSPSQDVTMGRLTHYRGLNLASYGEMLPAHFNVNPLFLPPYLDTTAITVDTAHTAYGCIPGQSGPGCTRYNHVNNPFDCDSTYSVNPQTGQIRFFTKTPGQHVNVTVRCDEYRSGNWLSTSYRMIRIHTIDSGYVSDPQFVLDTPNVQQAAVQPNLEFHACAGSQIRIPFDIMEPNRVGFLRVSDNHNSSLPQSNLTYQNNNSDSVRAVFTWNTLPTDSGWYDVRFTIVDSSCALSEYVFNTTRVMRIFISKHSVEAMADTLICQGSGISLSASGGGSNLIWNVVSGTTNSLSCSSCTSPIVTPAQTSSYEVVSQLTGACKQRDTLSVFVQEPYNVQATDLKVCGSSDSVQLQSTISSTLDPSAQIISWQPLAGIYGSNNTQAIWVNPNVGTQYIVSVADTLGCFIASDTASIDYDAVFAPFLNATNTDICLGDTVGLSVFGPGADQIVYSPNYNISGLSGPTVRVWPSQDTVYEAVVTSNTSGCTTTLSKRIRVSDIQADAGPDYEIFDGEELRLGGPNYRCNLDCELSWTPSTYIVNPGVYNQGQALVRPFEDITYVQTVRSRNGGCVDKDTVHIKVKCTDIYMPNVFSPAAQSTNRKNQSFGPNNNGLEILEFRIFNRWGQQVFQSRDDATSEAGYRWSGNYNGKPQPVGVYVWFIKAKCRNTDEVIEKQGNVTLVR